MPSRISIVFLGEKDHGKSTLIGRLLSEKNAIPRDRIEEAQRAAIAQGISFEYAHLLDSFREERQRGMTQDTTRAYLSHNKITYELIDVPGHDELLKNRLVGVSSAQVGVLVIAADAGITAQTKKHIALAQFMRLRSVIVVVNKMDCCRYPQRRFKSLSKKAKRLLRGAHINVAGTVATIANEGENLVNRSERLKCYGSPLIELMESSAMRMKAKAGRTKPCAVVQDVYDSHIAVRIIAGTFTPGMQITAFPSHERARIATVTAGAHPLITFGSPIVCIRGDVITIGKRTPFQSRIRAECILLKRPNSKKIRVESYGRETTLISIRVRKKNPLVHVIELTLTDPLFFHHEFVLTSRGSIIGLCRTR